MYGLTRAPREVGERLLKCFKRVIYSDPRTLRVVILVALCEGTLRISHRDCALRSDERDYDLYLYSGTESELADYSHRCS